MKRRTTLLLALIVLLAAATRAHQHVAHADKLTLQTISGCYISMAVNLPSGLGMVNWTDNTDYLANPYAFLPARTTEKAKLAPFFNGLDPGLSLMYAVAIALFGHWTSGVMALTWLQIIVDVLCVVAMFCVGRRLMRDDLGGLLAAGLYALFNAAISLASTFPFYYYWTGAFAVLNLLFVGVLLDDRMPGWPAWRRLSLATAYGAMLGVASMTRSFFLPMGVLMAGLVLLRHRTALRRALPLVMVLLAVQTLVLMPMFARNYARFHRLTTRWMWHTAYIGFGAHPNPLGIVWDDSAGLAAATAHGFNPADPDWEVKYDDIMHDVVLDIYRSHGSLAIRNAAFNIFNGLTGFDGGFSLVWRPGERLSEVVPWQMPAGLSSLIRSGQPVIFLMLTLQLAAFVLFLRRRADAWLYAAALLSTFPVFLVGALCPPWVLYNSAYTASFVLFTTVALWCLARTVIKGFASGIRGVDARLLKGAAALLLVPSLAAPHLHVLPHLMHAVTAFATLLAIHALLLEYLDRERARGGFMFCAVMFSIGLLDFNLKGRFLAGLVGPAAWPSMLGVSLVLIAMRRRVVAPPLAGLLAVFVTVLRPIVLLVPMLYLTFLGRDRSNGEARRLSLFAGLFGALTWLGLAFLMHHHLLDRETLDALPSQGAQLWLVAAPLAAGLLLAIERARLVAATVVLLAAAFTSTAPAWTLLGAFLLMTALRKDRDPASTQESRAVAANLLSPLP